RTNIPYRRLRRWRCLRVVICRVNPSVLHDGNAWPKGMARERPFPFVYLKKLNVRSERGFTIMELVAVMVIVAILAVSAVSYMERRSFDAAGFADELRAQLAYGQKIAVASRRAVTATVA